MYYHVEHINAFIDFSRAFGGVPRDILYQQLKCYGVSNKMLEVMMTLYNHIESKMKSSEENSVSFYQYKSLMQGECLSPTSWGVVCGVFGVGCLVWGVGCGVWGVGCGVWGVACGVWGVGFGVWGVGCGVWGLGSGV